MSSLVFGESNGKNHSKNGPVQNNNMQETEKANQHKVENSHKFVLQAMFCCDLPYMQFLQWVSLLNH